jgi:heme/copper-type cytochrome/quinol oxidase subunit 1
VLGAWQMFVRSPLNAWHFNPEFYYRSVTAHGSAMGYVFPTLIAMGFGYAITESALAKPLIGRRWAWVGFLLVAVGAVVALIPVSLGLASVLYTFYPPMVANPFYYIGVVMVVVGSWIWVALIPINRCRWRCSPMSRAPISGAGPRSARHSKSFSRSSRWRSASGPPSMLALRACSSPGRCMRSSISG